jgi:uncharacterized protein YoxC
MNKWRIATIIIVIGTILLFIGMIAFMGSTYFRFKNSCNKFERLKEDVNTINEEYYELQTQYMIEEEQNNGNSKISEI